MEIKKCQLSDVNDILLLYEAARSLQAQRKMVVWPGFDKSFIENEIREERQWKMIVDNIIVCNWAVTFEDKEIWGNKDNGASVYIHRICNNPEARGHRYIDNIVKWAKDYAKRMGKLSVRLDTLGNNTKLIQHYTSAGFKFLAMVELTDTATLPKHYQDEPNCCLFEIDLQDE